MAHLIKIAFTTEHRQFIPGTVTDFDFGEQRAADLLRDGFIEPAPEPEPEPEAPAEPQEAEEAPAPRFRRK